MSKYKKIKGTSESEFWIGLGSNGRRALTTANTQDDLGDGEDYKQYSAIEQSKLAGIATAAEAWVAVVGGVGFENSWVNHDGAGTEPAGYYKDPWGVVRLRGLVKSGASGTVVFTLPSGYRPPYDFQQPIIAGYPNIGGVIVGANGLVYVYAAATTEVSLHGVSFRV